MHFYRIVSGIKDSRYEQSNSVYEQFEVRTVRSMNSPEYEWSWVRMVQGTNGPGYEWSRVRMVQGTNGPRYEWSKVRMIQGTNSPVNPRTMAMPINIRAKGL